MRTTWLKPQTEGVTRTRKQQLAIDREKGGLRFHARNGIFP